ncbi:hypothetical protein GCM10023224_14100 [Streptomonospora halophila]|uniref:Protein kinase domain-containing protein n=2 Tax=Streptomonospora halophila TaxID=427369 RepID=A0ABP9GIM6_9ACTN
MDPLESTHMPSPLSLKDDDPTEIGGLRLIGRLGAGGQGTVYLAEQAQGGSLVAIKCLSAAGLEDPRIRQRFVREAEAARQVASFCTATVLAADFEAESPYIVSEYVEGRSLSQRIRQDGPMSGGDLGRLAVATGTALVAIHEAGIVHRDFKPGNVLFGDGGARVIDFGIAQNTEASATLTNSPIGTPAFMAPEQIASGQATAASDVFAWGGVLVFAATGASPFNADTVANVLHNVLHVEPDLSAVPDEVRPLVRRALSKDPEARPSAVDVLMTLLGRQGTPANPDSLSQAMRDAQTAVSGTGAPTGVTATTAMFPNTGMYPHTTMSPPTDMPPNTWDTPYGQPPARKPGSRLRPWLIGIGALLVAGALMVAAVMGALLDNILVPLEGGGGTSEGGSDPQADSGAASGAESESAGESTAPENAGDAASEGGNGNPKSETVEPPVEPEAGEPDGTTVATAPPGVATDVDNVQVGDCFNDPSEESTAVVFIVDCAEPHDAEVFGFLEVDGNRAWPGAETLGAEAQAGCKDDMFSSYVGVGYDSSMYYLMWYTPSESSWDAGDYVLTCSVHNPDGKITGSVAGVAR